MSGPRVTSGEDSKQDYATPADFIAAVERRFGTIQFDLAAHRGNHQHERYFAPAVFIEKFDPAKQSGTALIADLIHRGADPMEAEASVRSALTGNKKTTVRATNVDPDAFALDAFVQDWSAISRRFANADGSPGLNWLNCQFDSSGDWAARCGREMDRGANTTLLTPAVTGANWSTDHVFGKADVYLLKGRLMFDGKNVFPKDCMLSHYHTGATGGIRLWDWKRDVIVREWADTSRIAASQEARFDDVIAQGRLFG